MNIVTSLCIDEETSDSTINYPATHNADSKKRRTIYWKSVTLFFGTSVRCNPGHKHILYTNDSDIIKIDGIDIKSFLQTLNIEIRYLKFLHFKPPPGLSHSFKNAFYKLDVLKSLTKDSVDSCILLDSDCVWIKPGEDLFSLINNDKLVLYDVYKSYLKKENIHSRRRKNLGILYKYICADYPTSEPIQFGGEIFGASISNLNAVVALLETANSLILEKSKTSLLKIDEETSIFDGDEFFSSFVFNNMHLDYVDAKGYIKRIWNALKYSNPDSSDLDLVLWHVPSEKTQGIPLLFKKVIYEKSKFWSVSIHELNVYLGSYLGVPKQLTKERSIMLINKLLLAVKRKLNKKITNSNN